MYQMLDNNTYKVLKEFYENPTRKFHIRELSRITKLNPNTIISITNKVGRKGFIKKKKHRHIVELSLNLTAQETLRNKRIFNILRLYDSGVIDFLINSYDPKFISIIGSYSRGEDIEKSDIDLVINTNKEEIIDTSKFERMLKRKIHLVLFSKKVSDEFFNNLINGIVLYGVLRR